MKKINQKDSGVSPVIGTILLVAITVVLVAIISAVVMGMTGNVGTSHSVGATLTQAPDESGERVFLLTITGTTGDVNKIDKTADKVILYCDGAKVGTSAFVAIGKPIKFIDSATPAVTSPGSHVMTASLSFTDSGVQTVYDGTLVIK